MIKAIGLMFISISAYASPLDETRYCGAPKRNAAGNIARSQAVIDAFKRAHPCPSTMQSKGACVGWSINHVIPLACGGCDSVSNMQWLPIIIKAGSKDWAIDRFERKIYASNLPDTASCKNELVILKDPLN